MSTTKAQRRRLRELAALAHERELSVALRALHAAFDRWQRDELETFELCARIHEFEHGPSRRLFVHYRGDADWSVADAIHRGIVSAEEAGEDILEVLARHRAFLRDHTK
jgi:hypothetical protein